MFFFCGEDLHGLGLKPGATMHSTKSLERATAVASIHHPIQADDRSEGARRIRGQSLLIGLLELSPRWPARRASCA